MCRPAKYADFDPDQDYMHVVDLQREEEIKDQIRKVEESADPITRRRSVQDLRDELALSRVTVRVAYKCFRNKLIS